MKRNAFPWHRIVCISFIGFAVVSDEDQCVRSFQLASRIKRHNQLIHFSHRQLSARIVDSRRWLSNEAHRFDPCPWRLQKHSIEKSSENRWCLIAGPRVAHHQQFKWLWRSVGVDRSSKHCRRGHVFRCKRSLATRIDGSWWIYVAGGSARIFERASGCSKHCFDPMHFGVYSRKIFGKSCRIIPTE